MYWILPLKTYITVSGCGRRKQYYTLTHARTHSRSHTHTHTPTHTWTHTYVRTHLQTHTPTHTNQHTHTNTHQHTDTHTSTHIHTPAHTHTHTTEAIQYLHQILNIPIDHCSSVSDLTNRMYTAQGNQTLNFCSAMTLLKKYPSSLYLK